MWAVLCSHTHQGEPVADLARWGDEAFALGVSVHLVEAEPAGPSRAGGPAYQAVERQHRAGMLEGIPLDDDDVVMCSDVDEIPNPKNGEEFAVKDGLGRTVASISGSLLRDEYDRPHVCEQRFHGFALDYLHPQQPWLGTIIGPARMMRLPHSTPQDWRDRRGSPGLPALPDAGWHLSWLGTSEERWAKLRTFSHGELDGTLNPDLAHLNGVHANGEPLRHLTPQEWARLDWPTPIEDGSFVVPDEWWAP
jgi:hypothetical protein